MLNSEREVPEAVGFHAKGNGKVSQGCESGASVPVSVSVPKKTIRAAVWSQGQVG